MIRVLMVLEATAGGTARHIVEVLTGCQRRGFEVHLACATRRDPAFRDTMRELRSAGVAVEEFDMRRQFSPMHDLRAAIRLRRIMKLIGAGILHLHSSKAGFLGRLAVAGLKWPRPVVVYTPHAYAFMTQSDLLKRCAYLCVEKALMLLTDQVAAVSRSEGQIADRLGARGRVSVIPNGVDVIQIARQSQKSNSHLRVGWLGRMVWQKNPEAAVRVSRTLSLLGVKHELLIGGDGPLFESVKFTIVEFRASDHIRMLGFVRDTSAFHSDIDVFLNTSRCEGLPYAGLDAMARGIPIVGFDIPGIRDLVEDGRTGLLARAGDTAGLAQHLARLSSDSSFRNALGEAATERVRNEYRTESQVDQLCSLYRKLACEWREGARLGHWKHEFNNPY